MFIPLTGERSWQRLRRSAVDLYSNSEKIALWATFRALRGNIRTPSMARWKARSRLYVRRKWTFFAISYGWDVMSGNRWKSAFFEGVGSLWTQISEWRGRRRPTSLGIRVAEWFPFRAVWNICSASFSFVTMHACDRRTDGQNYDSQDRPRICSRGNKIE